MTETELLFTGIFNCDRLSLYRDKGLFLNKERSLFISSALKRRIKGEPLQYILGKTEFMGLEFKVSPDVFIPRPETEILIEAVLKIAGPLKILDIGTGSGCIAVSLAKFLPDARITATDISKKALGLARQNAAANNVSDKINFIHSDLYFRGLKTALFRARIKYGRSSISFNKKPRASARGASFKNYELRLNNYDAVISNPPYIPAQEIDKLQPEVRYEPKIALDGGEDGLAFYRRIIDASGDYLKKGGFLIMEMGFNQKEKIENIFQKYKNFEIIEISKDYNHIDRVIVVKKARV